MLTRSLWKLLATMCNNSKITRNNNQHIIMKQNRRNKIPYFRIKMDKINDSIYFMELIRNQHPLSETNRMLENIVKGSVGINRNNFQTIFKKYCYYIQHIRDRKGYLQANLDDKINFLDNVTQVYSKLGELAGVNMIKTFNKVYSQIYQQIKARLKNQSSQQLKQSIISKLVLTLCCVARYNRKKSISCYISLQKILTNHKYLSRMSQQTALSYMQLFSKTKIYNRLIIQVCIDVLKDKVFELGIQDLKKTIYCLASSHYPINKHFVINLTKKIDKQLNKQVDPNSGVPYAKNQFAVRQNLRLLQSLSIIQTNMNLASAYLPQISAIYQIELMELSNYFSMMNDKDILFYAGLLRRSCYFDQVILKSLINQVFTRKIKQLQQLDIVQSDNIQQNNKNKSYSNKSIGINTLCAILHTFANFSYRNQALIEYFIKTIQLIRKKQKLKLTKKNTSKQEKNLINLQQKGNLLEQQFGFMKMIYPKYYSRVIWTFCVLAQKEQIAQVYPFFQYFFIRHFQFIDKTPEIYQLLNFYYCYLLLKTYFPRHKLSFQSLIKKLQNKQIQSKISITHAQIYNYFIKSGVAALRQHNINNLMCDIFIPQYTSTNGKYQVSNVIIDVHGHHHFMRNCDRIKGNGRLKQKLLQNEGYIYQFIGVHEWELADNKKQFILFLMNKIAEKFGKEIDINQKRRQNQQTKLINGKQEGKIVQVEESQLDQISQQTTKIKFNRKKRRIRTNSYKLSNKLN